MNDNKKSNEYVINGSSLDETITYNEVRTLVGINNKIDDWTIKDITTRRSLIDICRISWMFRRQVLIKLNMSELIGYLGDILCMCFWNEEEEKYLLYFLYEYPALPERRLGIFQDLKCKIF